MKSMTGYAYVYEKTDAKTLEIVLRSTNYKYLDITVRNLMREDILLEEKIKKEIKKQVCRGKIEVYVFLKSPVASEVHIDEKNLAQYISQVRKISRKYKIRADISVSDVLNLPHVLWWEEKRQNYEKMILPAVKKALGKLSEFKIKEGKTIQQEITANLKRLKYNAAKIKERKPQAQGQDNNKVDIDEEISLLIFYLEKLERNVADNNQALKGRSIDFLTQEILRELNAASSKTKDAQLASLIVESKNYLERIREQAQNIE